MTATPTCRLVSDVIILAGALYADPLIDGPEAAGLTVHAPLATHTYWYRSAVKLDESSGVIMPRRKSESAEPEAAPGTVCNCERCGAKCKVAVTRNAEAKLLRHATVAKGMCGNCAVTEWLVNTYPVNMIIEESRHGPAILLYTHIQEQFMSIARSGNADITAGEIDWQSVVDNWSLPLRVKPSPTNTHMPGDSVRRKLTKRHLKEQTLDRQLKLMIENATGYPATPSLRDRLDYIPEEGPDDGGYIC